MAPPCPDLPYLEGVKEFVILVAKCKIKIAFRFTSKYLTQCNMHFRIIICSMPIDFEMKLCLLSYSQQVYSFIMFNVYPCIW